MSQHQIPADLTVSATDDQVNTVNTSLSQLEQQERLPLQNQQQKQLNHSENNDTCSKNNISSYEPPVSEVEKGHQQEQEEEPWHIVNSSSCSSSRYFQKKNVVNDIDHNNLLVSSVLHPSASSSSLTTSYNNKSSSIIEDEKEKVEKKSPNMVTQDEVRLLHEELEKEKKTVAALQNQKEATTKDLDYFGRIVEKLTEEKSLLSQRLDLEKDFRLQVDKDRHTYEEQIRQRDEKIDHLSTQLGKAEEQVQALKFAMEQLVKTTTAVATTSGLSSSESIISDNTATEKSNSGQQREQQQMEERSSSSQIASRTLAKYSGTNAGRISENSQILLPKKPSTMVSKIDSDVLDRELRDLTQEKDQILLQYSKIPISGGSRQSRRQKEQLEDRLDKVDSQLSRVKQKIRTRGH
ncbi:hypothetical protein INT45_004801 [Circinella minor]|uniref:Enkurin domain-containing protein n=1 Tax=Circinella minor TaxID=1195481 RepID=A0A8H7SCF5_9FUNG|nr:hypothetical protein INT45_004801 [Circinella minor]